MPARTDEATDPAAAITATPSIRQARKMRNPFSPPRSSRRARLSARDQRAGDELRLYIARRGRLYRLFIRDLAVDQVQGAGAAGGDHGIVGDQQQGRAALGAQGEHEVDDVAA